MPENGHNFHNVQDNTLDPPNLKCQGFGHKAPNCTKKNVLCMVKLIHTKTAQIKKKESLNTQIVGDLMLPTIEAVLHIRTKLLGSMWSKNRFLMHQS